METIMRIGGDMSQLERTVDAAERKLGGLGATVNKAGKGSANLGGLAMQLQDVAVQAQMGTSAMTILTQQGSQAASIFGPAGMIVGGVLALGGAFYTVGVKADEAIKKAMQDVKDLHVEVGKLATSGASLDQFAAMFDKIRAKSDQLVSARAEYATTWGQIKGILAALTGGENVGKQRDKLEGAMQAMFQERQKIGDALLVQSGKLLEIAQLRGAGRDKEAEALERKLDLEKELARIQQMRISLPLKDKLVENALALAAAKESEERTKASAAAEEKKAAIVKKAGEIGVANEEKKAKFAFDQLSTEEKLLVIRQKIAGVNEAAQSFVGPSDPVRAAELQGQLIDLLQQETTLKQQLNREQDDFNSMVDETNEAIDKQQKTQKKADDDKRNAQREALGNLNSEISILEAKATGQDKLAQKLEKEQRIREKIKSIMESTGVDAPTAKGLAEKMVGLEDRSNERDLGGGGRRKIRGASAEVRERGYAKARANSGLHRLYEMQDEPNEYDKLQARKSKFWELQDSPAPWDVMRQKPSAFQLLQRNARREKAGVFDGKSETKAAHEKGSTSVKTEREDEILATMKSIDQKLVIE